MDTPCVADALGEVASGIVAVAGGGVFCDLVEVVECDGVAIMGCSVVDGVVAVGVVVAAHFFEELGEEVVAVVVALFTVRIAEGAREESADGADLFELLGPELSSMVRICPLRS